VFVCRSCELEKPASEYRVHKRGYRIGKCRPCENAYQREWTQREPDKIRKRKRESMAKRRAADPEGARAYRSAWHAANRDVRTAKMREYAQRRFFWNREMHLRQPGRATARQLARLWKDQRGRCALTGRRLDRTAHLDHIEPLAGGGGDGIGNLRWLCHEANLAKRALSDDQFFALCLAVAQGAPCMSWIGRRLKLVDSLQVQEAS
jgi:hypothetical protein